MTCNTCGAPIDVRKDFRKVEGYERIQREGGGTNAVALRKTSEEFKCKWCVDKAQRGISHDQGSLL